MNLNARYRLVEAKDYANPWPTLAMPQISPMEHTSEWFDPHKFAVLKNRLALFEYGGHEVCAYRYPNDLKVRIFAALKNGNPVYVNEVHAVDVQIAKLPDERRLWENLSRYSFWTQTSVAFSGEADRPRLKGLATKIFWDYLASDGNVAITDSQQTASAQDFWLKITTNAYFMPVVVTPGHSTHELTIVGLGHSPEFVDRSHVQYDIRKCWTESAEGKNLRVLVTRNLR